MKHFSGTPRSNGENYEKFLIEDSSSILLSDSQGKEVVISTDRRLIRAPWLGLVTLFLSPEAALSSVWSMILRQGGHWLGILPTD